MAIDLSRKPKNALTPAPVRRWPFAGAAARAGGGVDWAKLLGVLWRRKGFVLGFVVVAVGLTYAYINSVTPQYRAETLVRLDSRALRPVDDSIAAPTAERSLESEVLLIESRAMAERLVDRLNLHLLPEFNPAMTPGRSGLLDSLDLLRLLPAALVQRLPDAWLEALLAPTPNREMTDLERAELLRERIIDAVFQRIEAVPQEGTTVIALSFAAADPELAALGANALAEGYLEERAAQRQAEVERAAAFLSREIERLQQQIAEAEARIQESGGGGAATAAEGSQLSQLTAQLVLARGERAAAETRLRQAARLLAPGADLSAAAEAVDSPVLDELRAQQIEINRRKAELVQQYGEGHPVLAELRAEEDALAARVRAEAEALVQALRDEVETALGREANLQSQLIDLKGQLSSIGGATGELRALLRQAEADRAVLESYLTRAVELRARYSGDQQTGARVISRAAIPDSPSYPPRELMLGLALGLALVVGSAAAFGLERLDDSFRSGQQIEEVLGLSTLALVPAIADGGHRGMAPESYVVQKPNSRFGEAVRSLRTALLLPRSGPPPKVVLFTSSVPEEGKTSMALSLARVNARAGRETVVVDCDLRRPRLHVSCGVENEFGLSDLLTGARTVDQVLHSEELSGMSFITAGTQVSDPVALLASERMKGLLESLSKRYELVVLDGPPLLSVSDARVLAQLAAKTVFLVRWGHTRRHDVMTGARTLTESGADVAGVVLTRVNARKHARYGYPDSGYYHNARYTKYYNE